MSGFRVDFFSNGVTTADFMGFGTWLDLREELMMLVITGSNSLLLSLMSQVGIGSSMQLFAGDLQIIFHTSASAVFRRTVRVETGGDCAISRSSRAVRKVIPNVVDLFLEKA